MKVEVTDAPNSQKEISIEVPYEQFEKAMDIESEKIGKDAKVPGFRPGKAPKDVIKKQYLHKIRSAALENLLNEAMRDALVSNGINPISQPEVRDVVLEDEQPITFKVYVDVFPQFNVDKFENYDFSTVKINVTDKDIEETLQRLMDQYTEFKPVAKKRKVKEGDQVVIDFEGKLDGVAFDGGKAEKHSLDIGSGQFIPGFEEGIIGMQPGETKDITVTFPEEYHQKDLAGKETVFTVILHEIKEKAIPELNDEFAKTVNQRFESVEALKEGIQKDLQNEANHFVKLETFGKILDKLIEENAFEIPLSVVNEQAERMAQQSLQQYYQMGINPEMFGMNAKSMAPQFVAEAEKQVKRALIIGKIAETEGIQITDEDINKELERISDITGRTVEDLQKEILSSQQLPMLQNDLLSDKVYDFLKEKNNIKETEMTREEFEKAKADEAAAAQAAADQQDGGGAEEEKSKKRAPKKTASKAEETDMEEEAKPAKKPAAKKPAVKKTTKKTADKEEA